MKKLLTILGAAGILLLALGSARGDVLNMGGVRDPATGTWTGLASVEFVPVGNGGNAADPDTGNGKVDYSYKIGKYDVTAGQYCEFLNAVAKASDPYGLYNINMDAAQGNQGCNIKRSGVSGNYNYTVNSGWANRPANFVSWGDAVRFCNWLQNGQKIGNEDFSTTESGAYTLGGAITDAALMAVTRNSNAKYFIPSLDEFYKAAYYDPNKNGPGLAGYWIYPTKHDTPPINILDPIGTNNANFFDDQGTGTHGLTIGGPYYRTEVGAFSASESPYGTYDQGGNVGQWNETVIAGLARGGAGGGFGGFYGYLAKTASSGTFPTQNGAGGGFRVASPSVPEPSVLSILPIIGIAGIFWQWRQRNRGSNKGVGSLYRGI
jgi:formylglycine-generating enzyme